MLGNIENRLLCQFLCTILLLIKLNYKRAYWVATWVYGDNVGPVGLQLLYYVGGAVGGYPTAKWTTQYTPKGFVGSSPFLSGQDSHENLGQLVSIIGLRACYSSHILSHATPVNFKMTSKDTSNMEEKFPGLLWVQRGSLHLLICEKENIVL